MTEGKVENRAEMFSRLPSEPLEGQREGKKKISGIRLCLIFSLKSGSLATRGEKRFISLKRGMSIKMVIKINIKGD